MEVEEIETKVDENQICFDFLSEPKTLTKAENYDWVATETLVLIVKSQNYSPEFSLAGKKMIDWVALASSGCKQKIIDDPGEENILEIARKNCENFNFVVVLYSDTPLIKKSTFLEIMDYFSKHRMNVMRLRRGVVFRGEYLKSAKMLFSTSVEEFGEEDFSLIDSAEKASFAFKILSKRILDFHKEHGVVLFGEDTIFIDADVEIEEGTIIYPNNIIKGESYIGKNVILESGNFILDTIVCDEAYVCQSYLEKSKVETGKIVGPFAKLIGNVI